jgi:hypothetical protein
VPVRVFLSWGRTFSEVTLGLFGMRGVATGNPQVSTAWRLRLNKGLMILMMACSAIVAPRLDGQTSPIAPDLNVLHGDVGSAKKIEVTTTRARHLRRVDSQVKPG